MATLAASMREWSGFLPGTAVGIDCFRVAGRRPAAEQQRMAAALRKRRRCEQGAKEEEVEDESEDEQASKENGCKVEEGEEATPSVAEPVAGSVPSSILQRIVLLSHAHSDHYSGLSEAFDARVPIYCSATTARLMRAKFPRVKFTALALDEEHTIPLIVSSMVGLERVAGGLETRELFMTVRLVPVEHCPGAVMFLCKSPVFGSVLYTGDFRLSEPLMNDARLCNVDALVLDTTNMNSGMCYFPPIEHGVSMAVAEARACAAADRDVVFRFRHLGFDLLLVRMAEDLGVPVRIHSRKLWKELKLAGLDMDQHFVMAHKAVDVRGEPRVHAVPYNDVDEVMERLRLARPKRAPRLLMACCLEERTARGQLRTDRIPFSRHSSHAELVDFIHHVGAKRIFALHMLGGYQIFVHGTSIRRGNPDSVNAALSAVPLAMKGGRFAAALDGLGRHMAQQVAAAKASLHFNQSRRHALRFRDQHALGRNAFATRSPKLGADRVAVLVAQSNARVEQSKRKAREQLDATAVGLADRTSRRPPAKPDSVQRNAETPPLFWSL